MADYEALQKFDDAGSFIWRNDAYTVAVCTDSSDNSYTFAKSAPYIRKLDTSGAALTAWGDDGTGPGQFTQPGGLLWLDGYVYAIDEAGAAKKVVKYSEWAIAYDEDSGTPPIYGLASLDGGSSVLVANKFTGQLEVYTTDGTLLHEFSVELPGFGSRHGFVGVVAVDNSTLFAVASNSHQVLRLDR